MTPFKNIIEATKEKKTYRCPCCHFRTLFGRGEYEICPACFWEDDGQDDHDADEIRGGPNRNLSLTEARNNYKKFEASSSERLNFVRKPLEDEK